MKYNKIFSRFFAIAAAFMAVACAEDNTVVMPDHEIVKPEPPKVEGSTLFDIEIDNNQILSGDIRIVDLNGIVKFTDNSEALVSHQWKLSENAVFVKDGVVDPLASDVSYDKQVEVQFLTADTHTVSVKNRYSEMVSFEFVSADGKTELINSVEDGNGYYIMEFEYKFKVYSQTYKNLEAKIYTDKACSTEAVISNDGLVSIPTGKKLYLKDVSKYSSVAEAPTSYKWVETSGYTSEVKFERVTDNGSISSVEFSESTEDGAEISLRMIVSREAGGDSYVSEIGETFYNGLSKICVYELVVNPLVVSTVLPYDLDHDGTTNQIEVMLDKNDVGVFSAESIAAANANAKQFELRYDNVVGDGILYGKSLSLGDNALSLIVTLDGNLYTNDTNITLTLKSDIEGVDSFYARPLSASSIASYALPYEPYNYFDDEIFNFAAMDTSTNLLDLGWNYSGKAATLSIAVDPVSNEGNCLSVDVGTETAGGHKTLTNTAVMDIPAGKYRFTAKLYQTAITAGMSDASYHLNLWKNGTWSEDQGILPTAKQPQMTEEDKVLTEFDDWKEATPNTITIDENKTEVRFALWAVWIKTGTFYIKDLVLEPLNDRPAVQ